MAGRFGVRLAEVKSFEMSCLPVESESDFEQLWRESLC
jgi:hypothetical protein